MTEKIQTKTNIGEAIRKGLEKKRWTQKKLADLMGVTPQLVSGWVKGKITPPGDVLLKLGVLLEIVSELFPGYEKKEVHSSEISPAELQKEIERIWQVIDQKDEDIEDFKRIIYLLLDEKLKTGDRGLLSEKSFEIPNG